MSTATEQKQKQQHGGKPRQQSAKPGCKDCAVKDAVILALTQQIAALTAGQPSGRGSPRSQASSEGRSSGGSPPNRSAGNKFIVFGAEDAMQKLCAKLGRRVDQLRDDKFTAGRKALTHVAPSEEALLAETAGIKGDFEIRSIGSKSP